MVREISFSSTRFLCVQPIIFFILFSSRQRGAHTAARVADDDARRAEHVLLADTGGDYVCGHVSTQLSHCILWRGRRSPSHDGHRVARRWRTGGRVDIAHFPDSAADRRHASVAGQGARREQSERARYRAARHLVVGARDARRARAARVVAVFVVCAASARHGGQLRVGIFLCNLFFVVVHENHEHLLLFLSHLCAYAGQSRPGSSCGSRAASTAARAPCRKRSTRP